jgi:hypothetical protein
MWVPKRRIAPELEECAWVPEEDGGESGVGESNNGEQPRERECTMIVDGELKHFGRQRIDIDGNIFILKHVNIYSS